MQSCKGAFQPLTFTCNTLRLNRIPLYLEETRTASGRYAHEYTREQHVKLLELLPTLKGHVVLSCYDSELYRDMLPDWHRVTHKAHSMRQAEREEVLYISKDFQRTLI